MVYGIDGFRIGTFVYLFVRMKQFQNIQKALQAIYEGNTNIELDSDELTGVLKANGNLY